MANNKKTDNSGIYTPEYTPEKRVKDYEHVISVLQSIGSSLQVEEILHFIVEEMLNLCNADQGSIVLIHKGSTEEPVTLIRHADISDVLLDHYLNTLICGWIINKRKFLISHSLSETFGEKNILEKYKSISSLISIPLIVHRKIVGILIFISVDPNKKFGDREVHLLNLLSVSCGQFIINAQLYESYFKEVRRLRNEISDRYSLHGIIGNSPVMQQLYSTLERVMATHARVLLEGESGTGKELIARILHYEGPRKNCPFVAIDCGAIPIHLFESELFGYVKGAFTGADHDRAGLMKEADGGTLFLDEITNMPLDIQSKFLRAMQEDEIRPVGSNRVIKVDVRIIAASSCGIRSLITNGKFREDLFYRLNIINITLPPLRTRRDDIALLANYFLTRISKKYGKSIKGFKPETIECMEHYMWPGNIRELENSIERIVVLAEDGVDYVSPGLLPAEIRYFTESDNIHINSGLDMRLTRNQFEKNLILNALIENNWNQSAAARQLGMGESTLRYKIHKFGLKHSQL